MYLVLQTTKPSQVFSNTESNVDIYVYSNNKHIKTISRKSLPHNIDIDYAKEKFNPNLIKDVKPISYVNNIDLFPKIPYMIK